LSEHGSFVELNTITVAFHGMFSRFACGWERFVA
jgi:hypothetical protein